MKISLLLLCLVAFFGAGVSAQTPVRDRMTAAEQVQYDTATVAANTVIKARLDERDALKAQIAALQAQIAQLQADLAAEKTKTANLQTQLNNAITSTKTKAETAAVTAIRAVQ